MPKQQREEGTQLVVVVESLPGFQQERFHCSNTVPVRPNGVVISSLEHFPGAAPSPSGAERGTDSPSTPGEGEAGEEASSISNIISPPGRSSSPTRGSERKREELTPRSS